jgi:hypothetical protein
MGWANGSIIADRVWGLVKNYIPEEEQQSMAYDLVELFCEFDADAWDANDELLRTSGYFPDGEDEDFYTEEDFDQDDFDDYDDDEDYE